MWPALLAHYGDRFEPLICFLYSECLCSYNVAQITFTISISGDDNMPANAVVRARIDEQIKEEATVVLASMGMTDSEAFRLLLTRIAKEKALPFEPLSPSDETIAAMKAARKGGLNTFDSVESLMADLNAED